MEKVCLVGVVDGLQNASKTEESVYLLAVLNVKLVL